MNACPVLAKHPDSCCHLRGPALLVYFPFHTALLFVLPSQMFAINQLGDGKGAELFTATVQSGGDIQSLIPIPTSNWFWVMKAPINNTGTCLDFSHAFIHSSIERSDCQ